MACNCFKNPPQLTEKSFKGKIDGCKCTCDSRFKAEENGRSFHIERGTPINIIDKIKVDGYLLNSNDFKKCDYLFIIKENPKNDTDDGDPIKYIFVELKGTEVTTAVKQIESTIDIFCNEGILRNVYVDGVLVFAKYPKNDGTYRKSLASLNNKFSRKVKKFHFEHKGIKITYSPSKNKYS